MNPSLAESPEPSTKTPAAPPGGCGPRGQVMPLALDTPLGPLLGAIGRAVSMDCHQKFWHYKAFDCLSYLLSTMQDADQIVVIEDGLISW